MVSARRPTPRSRELGQNFLADRNILGVIERLAELSQRDVVLEVGGGMGVLSERLAARVRHVHVVEVDRGLEVPLREVLAAFDNVTLHFADALSLDLGGLDPAPSKVVANLPYGVAATVILRTIDELPGVESWVVMVQREVGERLAAEPGAKAYGAISVKVSYWATASVVGRVPASVFIPKPKVESVLVSITRRESPAVDPATVESQALFDLVRAGFGQRRKMLRGALAGLVPPTAFEAAGVSPELRAEQLPVADWGRLAAAAAAGAPAAPGVASCGGPRA